MNDTYSYMEKSVENQQKSFTFGILAYNQENEIVYTLESIKYQIKKYGNNYANNLVITDDFSKDNTTNVIDEWLIGNSDLFEKVIKQYNKENYGVVNNYQFILSKIGNEAFKIIAGDDLISKNDIYKCFENMSEHTLYIGSEFFFKSNEVFVIDSWLRRHFYLMNKKMSKKRYMRYFKMGLVISTPQTLFCKKLYEDSNAVEFNSKFKLFEDNPTWYAMIKNVSDIDIRYVVKPVVLYRISEKSISNKTKSVNVDFQNELYKLHDQYIRDGNVFDKLYFASLRKNYPPIFNFSKYVNRLFFARCWLYCKLHHKKYKSFYEIIKKELAEEKNFFMNIR